MCGLPRNLTEVTCLDGFEDKGGACNAIPTSNGPNLQVILGACIGVVRAVCAGLLGFLAGKNPAKIKKIFLSFLRASSTFATSLRFYCCKGCICEGAEVKLALKIFRGENIFRSFGVLIVIRDFSVGFLH